MYCCIICYLSLSFLVAWLLTAAFCCLRTLLFIASSSCHCCLVTLLYFLLLMMAEFSVCCSRITHCCLQFHCLLITGYFLVVLDRCILDRRYILLPVYSRSELQAVFLPFLAPSKVVSGRYRPSQAPE